jgi:hypothetical protein
MTLVLAAVLLLTLVAPALARVLVISDSFDRMTGKGVAVIRVDARTYAQVLYRDADRSMSFSDPDEWLTVRYFRPRADLPVLDSDFGRGPFGRH